MSKRSKLFGPRIIKCQRTDASGTVANPYPHSQFTVRRISYGCQRELHRISVTKDAEGEFASFYGVAYAAHMFGVFYFNAVNALYNISGQQPGLFGRIDNAAVISKNFRCADYKGSRRVEGNTYGIASGYEECI
ncbi:hypothetical protein SDC9_163637 [bioreactor metagenome]|uniref:Uncharacterized protein n=1 Tax=bioreactor metagenome TaxID=1076179 RepID=A0A645FS87_9ZZZZ